jgi:hypothetical protein
MAMATVSHARVSGVVTLNDRRVSNYALERSVKCRGWHAASAQKIIAPAVRRPRVARPAQRERYAAQ